MNQCDIVQDLLPLYVEGMTRIASSEMVKEHLKTCPDCSAALAEISQPIEASPSPEKEVDYLKKIRRKTRLTAFLFTILSLFVITLLAGLCKFYLIGEVVAPYEMNEWSNSFSADENTVTISGKLRGDLATGRVKVYPSPETGFTHVKIYRVYPSFLHNSSDFSVTVPYSDDLNIELQFDGDRELAFDSRWVLPNIYEVKDDVTVFVRYLQTREMWGEIEAILAASTDTGIPSTGDSPQADYYFCFNTHGVEGGIDPPAYRNIYVYEREGNYYYETQGETIKQLSVESYNKLCDYVEQAEIWKEVVEDTNFIEGED